MLMSRDKAQEGTSTILLVEDDPAHATLVIRELEGHRVPNYIVNVSDGEAALDYLFRRGRYADAQNSPRPWLILLDLRLPKIDGLEVLKEIKSRSEVSSIPVVILTTSQTQGDLTKAYVQHVNSYLVKPVDFAQFTNMLDDLSYYWLHWNHVPDESS